MSKTKPYTIPKQAVWEAYLRVKANQGSAGVDEQSNVATAIRVGPDHGRHWSTDQAEPDALRAASVWMQGFGQFEPVNLDAFERFLEVELPSGDDP